VGRCRCEPFVDALSWPRLRTMTRMSIFMLLILAMCNCHAHARPRIRREIRSWTTSELIQLRNAMIIMTNTSRAEGRKLYGADFQPLAHISMLHAVAVLDPRGDQGHSNWSPDQPQACFYSFHNALLAMIENSLRAIDPRIEAIPYWCAMLDSPGGKYHISNRSIYTIIGASTGDPDRNYEVSDGLLPHQIVPQYPDEDDREVPATARKIFPRPPAGWTRNHAVADSMHTWRVQRYPANNTLEAIITIGPNTSTSMSHYPLDEPQTEDVVMSPEMLLTCRGTPRLARARRAAGALNVNTYLACMDYGTYDMVGNRSCPPGHLPNHRSALQWQDGQCQQLWMHSQGHFKIGGQSVAGLGPSHADWLASWPYDSDLIDLATSPNDFLIFILWHANIMKHFLRWQRVAVEVDPTLAQDYYGFPKSKADYSAGNKGCNLDDVINSNMPFVSATLFPHPPNASEGYSHREVMQVCSPGPDLLYDYDDSEEDGTWEQATRVVERMLLATPA